MKRLFPFIAILFLLPVSAFSQTDDFGIWYSAGGSMSLTRSLSFKLEGAIRTFDDASKIDEGFGEAGLSLQVLRFLSVSGSYRLTSKLEDDGNHYLRHKLFIDVKGKTNLGRIGLSCRLREEHVVKTYIKNIDDEYPDDYGRIKLEASYNIPKSKFEPIVYYETFSKLFEATEKTIEKYRLSAGVAFKINKKNKVEVSYIFQRDFLPHQSDLNIISLSYDFKI
jgi:hypothetical protein